MYKDWIARKSTVSNALRKTLGQRLQHEFRRRDLSADDVSEATGIPLGTVNRLLHGEAKFSIQFLFPVARHLGISPSRLLSADYVPFKSWMDNLSPRGWLLQGILEEFFWATHRLLPRPVNVTPPWTPELCDEHSAQKEAAALGEWLYDRWQAGPEEIARQLRLPVIVFRTVFDIQASLLTTRERAAICLNTARPEGWTRFVLAHQLCHFIFHRHRDLTVDTTRTMAVRSCSGRNKNEYLANLSAKQLLFLCGEPDSVGIEELISEQRRHFLELFRRHSAELSEEVIRCGLKMLFGEVC